MININKLNQNNQYSLEKPNIPTKRSTLIMRETNQTTGDVGKIIPFFVHEMLPSETFKANTLAELQFTPFVTNLVHEIKGEILTYFVPYRIIWDKWERFITGCDEENDEVDGTIIEELPKINSFWIANAFVNKMHEKIKTQEQAQQQAEIWEAEWEDILKKDYNITIQQADKNNYINTMKNALIKIIGMTETQLKKPMTLSVLIMSGGINLPTTIIPEQQKIYMKVQSKVLKKGLLESNYDYYGLPIQNNWMLWLADELKNSNQERVILISSLIDPQETSAHGIYLDNKDKLDNLLEGEKIEKPIALNFWAYNKIYNDWIRRMDWEPRINKDNLMTLVGNYENDIYTRARRYQLRGAMPTVPVNINGLGNGTLKHQFTKQEVDINNLATHALGLANRGQNDQVRIGNAQAGYNELAPHALENVQIEGGGSWNILDMTTPAGILNYYLANARIKPRYAEQLLARWGVTIQDARFQYAQFVDSTKINISQNGVTQTSPQSGESTAQGNITGQAWGNGDGNIRFYAPEHGVLISYIQITPANAYENGMKHEYIKKTKFDYPTPELVDTPDVPLYKSELVINSVGNVEENELGYIAIYDEYRTKTNRVTGLLRPSIKGSLGAKTLARYFEDDINMETLIKCKPDMERIKQFTTQPDFILYTQTSIKTSLPLPYINDPRIMI